MDAQFTPTSTPTPPSEPTPAVVVPAAPVAPAAETPQVLTPTTPLQHALFVFDNYIRYILSKGLVILLTFFSFYVTWEVVLFVLFEYPEVQLRFAEQAITQAEVDELIATAVIAMGATVAGAVLAIRLNSVQEKITHTIDIIMAISLIVFQAQIRAFILSLEVVKNWSQYLTF